MERVWEVAMVLEWATKIPSKLTHTLKTRRNKWNNKTSKKNIGKKRNIRASWGTIAKYKYREDMVCDYKRVTRSIRLYPVKYIFFYCSLSSICFVTGWLAGDFRLDDDDDDRSNSNRHRKRNRWWTMKCVSLWWYNLFKHQALLKATHVLYRTACVYTTRFILRYKW